ncbi:MAG: hypothetical protein RL662_707 [Bacteroidota bacterium]|jgi:gliding motility-associated-like protein
MIKLKLTLLLFSLWFCVHTLPAQPFVVAGGLGVPFAYADGLANTGIDKVYFLNTLSGATLTHSTSASVVRFYKYTRSISDKEPISASHISTTGNGNTTTYVISNIEDGKGYLVESNGATSAAIWVVDYAKHQPQLNTLTVQYGEEPALVKLLIDKSDDLFYYANDGTPHRVKRLYSITYNTWVWNAAGKDFEEKVEVLENRDVGTEYVLQAPLRDTPFRLAGDQIAQHFGIDHSLVTPYQAKRVEAHIVAEQIAPSEPGGVTTALGGSAPIEITFSGKANEPVATYYTWFIYKKQNLESAIARYTDKDIRFVFKESGDYVVQLEVADQTSSSIDTAHIEFNVTDFKLEVPNFLLIDGTHQFKVSYKSVLNFRCTIFNRWGNKIYEFTDPLQGWDGRYKGSYVSPGVYFYVITAEGGDGKKHQKKGDINVLRSK